MSFLDIFKHLLPRARAWHITIDKNLRRLFIGLSSLGDSAKEFADNVWLDIFPQTTRDIQSWEDQFNLYPTDLTEQERRDRLDGTWKAQGGQSPRYIQDTLQANGFNVYVHEWWIAGAEAQAGEEWMEAGEPEAEAGNYNLNAPYFPVGIHQRLTPKNPFLYLNNNNTQTVGVLCGNPDALFGNPNAIMGNFIPRGYPLVNKVYDFEPNYITLAGEDIMEAGEPLAEAGNYVTFDAVLKKYPIPTNPDYWSYFLYIGGENFPDLAQIEIERKEEFEALCLKICPTQQWLGILVEYI